MKRPDEDLGYYAGWGIAYLLGAGIFFYALWRGSAESWCAPRADGHCFREWISALSGWAAALITLPSVIYLARQIRASDRQHRTAMLNAMRPLHANAWRVRELAQMILNEVSDMNRRWEAVVRFPGDAEGVAETFRRDTSRLRELISADDLRTFEQHMLIPRASSTTAIKDTINRHGALDGMDVDNMGPLMTRAVGFYLSTITQQVELFARSCLDACDRVERDIAEVASGR